MKEISRDKATCFGKLLKDCSRDELEIGFTAMVNSWNGLMKSFRGTIQTTTERRYNGRMD